MTGVSLNSAQGNINLKNVLNVSGGDFCEGKRYANGSAQPPDQWSSIVQRFHWCWIAPMLLAKWDAFLGVGLGICDHLWGFVCI
jgi:hypothetical protein